MCPNFSWQRKVRLSWLYRSCFKVFYIVLVPGWSWFYLLFSQRCYIGLVFLFTYSVHILIQEYGNLGPVFPAQTWISAVNWSLTHAVPQLLLFKLGNCQVLFGFHWITALSCTVSFNTVRFWMKSLWGWWLLCSASNSRCNMLQPLPLPLLSSLKTILIFPL